MIHPIRTHWRLESSTISTMLISLPRLLPGAVNLLNPNRASGSLIERPNLFAMFQHSINVGCSSYPRRYLRTGMGREASAVDNNVVVLCKTIVVMGYFIQWSST